MAEPVRKMPADRETETAPPSADPFRYGWRWRRVRLPSGEETVQQIPLTAEDLLDPQHGDEVSQSGPHFSLLLLLAWMLRRHFEPREDVYVAGDMKMLWGIPGLPEPAPDIAVIPGVRRKLDPEPESWDIVREGARPCLIIELVSKDAEMRRNDYEKKVKLYQRVGIPEYVIAEPPGPPTQDRLLLTGHRLDADGRYRRIEPDPQGYLLSETTNLLFGVSEDGRTIQVVDAITGKRLLTPDEEAAAREAAEAEIARLQAELERLKGR